MLLNTKTTNETDIAETAVTAEVQHNVTVRFVSVAGCTVSRSVYRVKQFYTFGF